MIRNPELAELAHKLKDALSITGFLAKERGISPRRTANGRTWYLCPLHAERTASFVVRAGKDGYERFRCFGCHAGGDIFDFMQALEGYPDYITTLRTLAERYEIPWPARNGEDTSAASRVLDAATEYYARELAGSPLAYLERRGFPEAFLKAHHVGYAPAKPGTGFTRYAEAQEFDHAAEAVGLIQGPTETWPRRDFFFDRIIFPNRSGGHTIDLQGRALLTTRKPKYLSLPGSRRRVYNVDACAHPHVILCEGIPDTLSVLRAGLPACGIYGTEGWTRELQPLFRRCRRVYVALDRDATGRAIEIAKDFGVRGRVLVPLPELGPKGDLNDWLVGPAKADPGRFKELLAAAMAQSPTPWGLWIEGLADVPLWDRHEQLEPLLIELASMPRIPRALHLQMLHEKAGISEETLFQAVRDLEGDAAAADEAE